MNSERMVRSEKRSHGSHWFGETCAGPGTAHAFRKEGVNMDTETMKEVELLKQDIKRAREIAKTAPLRRKMYLNGRALLTEKIARLLLRAFGEKPLL